MVKLVEKGYAITEATTTANQAILNENEDIKQAGLNLLTQLNKYKTNS